MNGKEKELLKSKLANSQYSFSIVELQRIIDNEFFDDSTEVDMNLIDLAIEQMAILNSVTVEEQRIRIAQEAMRKILFSPK